MHNKTIIQKAMSAIGGIHLSEGHSKNYRKGFVNAMILVKAWVEEDERAMLKGEASEGGETE